MELPELELIAIHIKKTAGMTFKHILKGEYGRQNYYRMNIRGENEARIEMAREKLAKIPSNTRVIQGHFRYLDALPLYEAHPDVPIITWLRDPVKRVVSRYYFSKRKFEEGKRKGKEYLENDSLIEFASRDKTRNEMSRVLENCDLADLGFVGILEFLTEDLADIAIRLGWGPYKIPERNTNVAYKQQFDPPTDEELEEIARLNQADKELYQYALALREQRRRLSAPG